MKKPEQEPRPSGLSIPLSDADLDALAGFLDALPNQDAVMSLSMADGFFTALALSPDMVMPGEWLPWVVGGEPAFDNPAQAQQMLTLLMRHYNACQSRMRANPPEFDPIYLYNDSSEEAWVADWCHGFVGGVNLRSDAWQEALPLEEDAFLLELLVGMSTLPPPGEEPPPMPDDPTEQELMWVQTRDVAVHALEDYRAKYDPIANWEMMVEMTLMGLRDRVLHPVRNSDCPCGSGKAFEHCCGAAGRQLH